MSGVFRKVVTSARQTLLETLIRFKQLHVVKACTLLLQQWKDGVLSSSVRQLAADGSCTSWLALDGRVDTTWADNLDSVHLQPCSASALLAWFCPPAACLVACKEVDLAMTSLHSL
jgi:hypothetical protein